MMKKKTHRQRFTGSVSNGLGWTFWPATGEVLCGQNSWKRKNEGMNPSEPGDETDKAIPIARVYGAKNYTKDIRFVEYRESEANARLIANAPAMWDLLIFLYENNLINDSETDEDVKSLLDVIQGDNDDWDEDE